MAKKKKIKLKGLDTILSKVDEDQREGLKAQIEEMFANFDPDQPLGKPVLPLEYGTKNCPECGEELVQNMPNAMQLPDTLDGPLAGKLVNIIDCETCDQPYMLEAKS